MYQNICYKCKYKELCNIYKDTVKTYNYIYTEYDYSFETIDPMIPGNIDGVCRIYLLDTVSAPFFDDAHIIQ